MHRVLEQPCLQVVSLGPIMATTRVVAEPRAMPIQIDSILALLAARLGRLRGSERSAPQTIGAGSTARRPVFVLSLAAAPCSAGAGHPASASSVAARLDASAVAVRPHTPRRTPARDRTAARAGMASACVHDALNQAKRVHRRAPPPAIRPPPGLVRQPSRRTHPPRRPGLGVVIRALTNLGVAVADLSPPPRPRPTMPVRGPAQISAILGARPQASPARRVVLRRGARGCRSASSPTEPAESARSQRGGARQKRTRITSQ